MGSAKAFLVAIFCAAFVSVGATRGATRDLQQASTTCSVRQSVRAFSVSQTSCRAAYDSASAKVVKRFCTSPTDYVPSEIIQTVEAEASAVATAIATAAVEVCAVATISPKCAPSSYASFKAAARAKAVAKAVAQSFARSWAVVVGPDAWVNLGAEVIAEATALAVTCEKKYVELLTPFFTCTKGACTTSSCPVTCRWWDKRSTEATATAIADAYANVQAIVQFYFESNECDADCETKMCSYVCPDGC